jgi:arylsulfatase A-like enzyme
MGCFIKNKNYIANILVIIGTIFPLSIKAAEQSISSRPHVVIFMSDDMGWNDVGYHGSLIHTPNIDQLAKEGLELDRFYVHSTCTPTRTALMTGRSPIRIGLLHGKLAGGVVPVDEHFLPQSFQSAGYQTFMVGKWHLGNKRDAFLPNKRGFDQFYGFSGGSINYYTHLDNKGTLDWQRNGERLKEEGYSTDLFATEAVTLLKNRDKSRPVFLYMPFNAPHVTPDGGPQAPAELVEKYQKIGFGGKSARPAAIESMDQAIGKVLKILDEEGMTQDTLVMFFCDNGPGGGGSEKRGQSRSATQIAEGTLHLRGGKGSLLEGGIRVPAVIRWPAVIKPGGKSQQLFSAQDILPTLTAAVGIEVGNKKPLDGVDVWSAIKEGKIISRKPVVIAGDGNITMLTDQWKFTQSSESIELFDVHKDPTETNDLSAEHPDLLTTFKTLLEPLANKILVDNPTLKEKGGGRKKTKEQSPGKRPGHREP